MAKSPISAFGGAHSEHSAAALCNVAHNVAEVVVGDICFKRNDRLKNCGSSLGDSRFKGYSCGSLERHFGRVNGVIRTVVKRRLDADHGIARDKALCNALS